MTDLRIRKLAKTLVNYSLELKKGSDEQIKYISPIKQIFVDEYDALLTIWGDYNTKPLAGVENL